MSEKIDLTGEKIVAGNIKDFQQLYQIFYYPKERALTDKIALYIYLGSNYKKYARRSIFFSSLEQLKGLILDLTKAYFYFKDMREIPDIEISKYRMILLDNLLAELRTKQIGEWRKGH